jgi:hypothetical protein
MIKTQIQLDEWQYDAVKRLGSQSSRSMAEVIREGVSLLLKRNSAQPHHDLKQLAGKYRAVDPTDLKDHDRHWAESIR